MFRLKKFLNSLFFCLWGIQFRLPQKCTFFRFRALCYIYVYCMCIVIGILKIEIILEWKIPITNYKSSMNYFTEKSAVLENGRIFLKHSTYIVVIVSGFYVGLLQYCVYISIVQMNLQKKSVFMKSITFCVSDVFILTYSSKKVILKLSKNNLALT